MNISNKHYRKMKKDISKLDRALEAENNQTNIQLSELKKQRDEAAGSIAHSIGRLLGHAAFKHR